MKTDKDKIKQQPRKESTESQLNASLGKFNYSGNPPTIEQEEKAEDKGAFWPLLLLILGGNLLILGLLQFFFSESGHLRLEWDSKYWFVYCVLALPVLYFGFKKAKQFKET